MKHPILSGSGYKWYTIIWMIVITVHGAVLYFYYDFPIQIAIVDSIVYNVIFGAIVPGFWFLVSFAGLNKDELSLIGTHSVAASITVFLWLLVSTFILKLIFPSYIDYQSFVDKTLVWRIIIGSLFYSISVLIFYLIKYYQDMQRRLHKELELQNLLKDTELRMLKSQINPHFIFNSLNSISALTLTAPKNARDMVIKLSDFLRYSLNKENAELNSLEQEIDNVLLYLDIERVRFGDRLFFEKEIAQECLHVKVPNLILQPLFENAIKHGVYNSLEKVTLTILSYSEKDYCIIEVSNNYDPTTPGSGEGIGLENVRKRLQLVYGSNDLLQVKKVKGLFKVILRIPKTMDQYAED